MSYCVCVFIGVFVCVFFCLFFLTIMTYCSNFTGCVSISEGCCILPLFNQKHTLSCACDDYLPDCCHRECQGKKGEQPLTEWRHGSVHTSMVTLTVIWAVTE